MTQPPTSILVIGAGELGTAILNHLAKHPSFNPAKTKITVLLRQSTISTTSLQKRAELTELEDLGLSFLAGDINQESEASLSSKFRIFEYIITCTGMVSPPGTQLKIARAVLAASVKHYIPWQFGVDYDVIGRNSSQDLFSEQLDVRDLLRSQNTTFWIIVSTGVFMSFLFEDDFGVVTADRKTVRALGSWNNRVTVTSVDDIGKIVAEIVLVEEGIVDQVVYIAGDTIMYRDLADMIEEVGGEIEREEWTIQKLKGDLEKEPNNGILKYRVVFADGAGVSWDPARTFNVQRGIGLESVRNFLQLG